jgi:hypothetical protein
MVSYIISPSPRLRLAQCLSPLNFQRPVSGRADYVQAPAHEPMGRCNYSIRRHKPRKTRLFQDAVDPDTHVRHTQPLLFFATDLEMAVWFCYNRQLSTSRLTSLSVPLRGSNSIRGSLTRGSNAAQRSRRADPSPRWLRSDDRPVIAAKTWPVTDGQFVCQRVH